VLDAYQAARADERWRAMRRWVVRFVVRPAMSPQPPLPISAVSPRDAAAGPAPADVVVAATPVLDQLCSGRRLAPELSARQEITTALANLGFDSSAVSVQLLDASLACLVEVRLCCHCTSAFRHLRCPCCLLKQRLVYCPVPRQRPSTSDHLQQSSFWIRMAGLQMLDQGEGPSETLAACDLLQQAARLSLRLAAAAVAEGALWRLTRLLFTFDVNLKARRRATGARPTRRLHLGSDVLAGSASPGRDAPNRPAVNWEHVASSEAVSETCCGQGEVKLAQAAMETLAVVLRQSEGARRAFLLLGGVDAAAALLTELQGAV
jgi:hypothetical protein